jgi:hypothetical protein
MFGKNERNIHIGGSVSQSNINVADHVNQALNVSETANEQPMELVKQLQTLVQQTEFDAELKGAAIEEITKLRVAVENQKSINRPVSTLIGISQDVEEQGFPTVAKDIKASANKVVAAYKQNSLH